MFTQVWEVPSQVCEVITDPSVLASLWKVDDRATARLMAAFYENLKTHDKAKSLQLAQLDMIREGLSPYYWAAFCLYGDYQ